LKSTPSEQIGSVVSLRAAESREKPQRESQGIKPLTLADSILVWRLQSHARRHLRLRRAPTELLLAPRAPRSRIDCDGERARLPNSPIVCRRRHCACVGVYTFITPAHLVQVNALEWLRACMQVPITPRSLYLSLAHSIICRAPRGVTANIISCSSPLLFCAQLCSLRVLCRTDESRNQIWLLLIWLRGEVKYEVASFHLLLQVCFLFYCNLLIASIEIAIG
jgi:hypothetical protein